MNDVARLESAGFMDVRKTAGGQSDATWFVTDVHDEQWVCKIAEPDRREVIAGQSKLLQTLRNEGYPAAFHAGPVEIPDGVLRLSKYVTGEPQMHFDAAFAEDALGLVDLLTNRAVLDTWSADTWTEHIARSLTIGFDGYCEHGSLETFDSHSRELLRWCRSVGNELSNGSLPDTDIVHYDFHVLNFLRDLEGGISAVIDWDGARSGDRWFDILTLAFADRTFSGEAAAPPAVIAELRNVIVQNTTAPVRTAYVAHLSLRLVDWAIRNHSEDVARMWIAHAHDWREWTRLAEVSGAWSLRFPTKYVEHRDHHGGSR